MSAPTPNKISAVLFDYGMVLCAAPSSDTWRRLESALHADESALHRAYWHYRDSYDRGSLSGEKYWHSVAFDLNQSLDEPTLKKLIELDNALWTQPNLPMMQWAAQLQPAGIKTGILSNIGDDMESGIRAHFPILEDFDHHTFSHRLGIAKPDLAIYQHAAKGLDTPAHEILFIDDKPENIAAAHAAGMQAIQYTTHEAFLASLQQLHSNLPSTQPSDAQ
jgi:putative hydrolase of the HAD superfamily